MLIYKKKFEFFMKQFTFLCSRVAVRTIFWVGGREEVVMGVTSGLQFLCIIDCFEISKMKKNALLIVLVFSNSAICLLVWLYGFPNLEATLYVHNILAVMYSF